MTGRVIRMVAIIAALAAAAFGYDAYDQGAGLASTLANEERDLASLAAEVQRMQGLPERPLQPREDTLEDFLGRLIDDTELLGSSVRIDNADRRVEWLPVRFNVEKAPLTVSTAADRHEAMGYFAILWEIMQKRPVAVRSATVKVGDQVTSLTVEVDLFGIAEGSP